MSDAKECTTLWAARECVSKISKKEERRLAKERVVTEAEGGMVGFSGGGENNTLSPDLELAFAS